MNRVSISVWSDSPSNRDMLKIALVSVYGDIVDGFEDNNDQGPGFTCLCSKEFAANVMGFLRRYHEKEYINGWVSPKEK